MKEKEPEFIVSPEELKKNQEKSYEKEYYTSKIKQEKIITTIILVLSIIMIILTIHFLNNYSEKEINHCISYGNSEYFCRSNL